MNIGVTGSFGERQAEKYLRRRFYKILSRNFQTDVGEIDIIAKKGKYILFCEVKTRKFGSMVRGVEAVDLPKQRRIVKSAEIFIKYYKKYSALQPRFDVIEVEIKDKEFKINHIENAFDWN